MEMDSYEIIKYIANSEKKSPVQVYIKGELEDIDYGKYDIQFFGSEEWGVIFADYKKYLQFRAENHEKITGEKIISDRVNSAVGLADILKYKARIEPGSIIREMVDIGENAVIMMGAVLNIGCSIGKNTMIDMNVVVGGRAVIGENCHIGAGTVVAGVIEPPSAQPVIIGNNVLVGANAIIIEGVKVGDGAVVAAGSAVINDVPPNTLVAGVPAKFIKHVDEKTRGKSQILQELRKL